MASAVELVEQFAGADNWTGHQLWKKGNVTGNPQEIPFRRDSTAVNIDGVTHRLKCIKGNANGQEHVRHCQSPRYGFYSRTASQARLVSSDVASIDLRKTSRVAGVDCIPRAAT